MVVKKFGSQLVCLSVHAPANGYVIDLCVTCKFSTYSVFTHRNLASFEFTNCLGVIWSSLTGN